MLRQLKIDVLSALVVTEKWEFGGPIQAHVVRGILSPEGDIIIAQRGAATRRNAGFGVNYTRNPERSEWVADVDAR